MKIKNLFLLATLASLLSYNLDARQGDINAIPKVGGGINDEIFITQPMVPVLSNAQSRLFLGIAKNDINMVTDAFLFNANVNQKNPLNGNSPLKEALVAYYKLLSTKFGWKTRLAAGIISSAAVGGAGYYSFGQGVKLIPGFYNSNESQGAKSKAIASFLAASGALVGALMAYKSSADFKRRLTNASKIITIILEQPGLVIDQDAIDFCKANLPEMEASLSLQE